MLLGLILGRYLIKNTLNIYTSNISYINYMKTCNNTVTFFTPSNTFLVIDNVIEFFTFPLTSTSSHF